MEKIKKYVPYMLITLASVLVFFREFGNCDELWNFSFARNIVNGLLPYKDYSIVQTPLSAYITSFFLLVFGDRLLSYRIAGYVLCVTIFCLFYYVCKTKSHSNLIASIATVFVMGLQMIPYIYNYNYLSAAIVLIIFAVYCKAKNHNTLAFNLLIGLLIGFTPLIKQNTGLFFWLANFMICVTEFFFLGKRKINVIVKFVASVIPMLIFGLIIFINGTANDFYEFAIDGIRTFSHRITPVDLAADAPISFVLLLIFASLMVASVVSMIRHNRFRQEYHFLFLSLASLSVVYPLCDSAHVLCAFITITPFIVSFIKPRKYKDIEKYICCFVSFVVAAVSIVGVFPAGSDYFY
ncbi:MAG: hypothetical protein Q4A15_09290, partial [Prevotellaceae bacterium]|nr:hypothetical protein [Prevotellaceae bacterium]